MSGSEGCSKSRERSRMRSLRRPPAVEEGWRNTDGGDCTLRWKRWLLNSSEASTYAMCWLKTMLRDLR